MERGLEAGLGHVLCAAFSLCDAGQVAPPLELRFPRRLFLKGRVTQFLERIQRVNSHFPAHAKSS